MKMSRLEFVQTRASSDATDSFRVVKYESHRSRKSNKTIEDQIKNSNINKISDKSKDVRKGIDIKRARREIIKFGMSGFDVQKKQEAKVALAVSLGAKPPKNQYRNYKLILEQKKQQKESDDLKKKLQQAGKNNVGVCIAKKNFSNKNKSKQNKLNSGLLESYGKATISKKKNFKPRRP